MTESPEKLESWQSIAEYLGVSVRTAQKWERERALPVVAHLAFEEMRPHAARSMADVAIASATSNPERQPSSWKP